MEWLSCGHPALPAPGLTMKVICCWFLLPYPRHSVFFIINWYPLEFPPTILTSVPSCDQSSILGVTTLPLDTVLAEIHWTQYDSEGTFFLSSGGWDPKDTGCLCLTLCFLLAFLRRAWTHSVHSLIKKDFNSDFNTVAPLPSNLIQQGLSWYRTWLLMVTLCFYIGTLGWNGWILTGESGNHHRWFSWARLSLIPQQTALLSSQYIDFTQYTSQSFPSKFCFQESMSVVWGTQNYFSDLVMQDKQLLSKSLACSRFKYKLAIMEIYPTENFL